MSGVGSEAPPPVGARAHESERAALTGERAQRIVAAMREAVGEHGMAGATFERVAAKAGVSRGLLHYHFGTKERLLVHVLRHDVELRVAALDRALAPTKTLDEVISVMIASLKDAINASPGPYALTFELFGAARQNEEIRRELAAHYERVRAHVAELFRQKEREGVLSLRYQPGAVVSYLMAAGEGIALQMLSDPERNHERALATGAEVGRFLLSND
jgi:AcrR family transcriptional regulator